MLAAGQWNLSQAANPLCLHGNIYFRQFFNFQVRWACWPLTSLIQGVFPCQVLFHFVLAAVTIQNLFLSAAPWSTKEQMLLCFCLFIDFSTNICNTRFPLKICTIYFRYGSVPLTVTHVNLANTDMSVVTLPTSSGRKGRIGTVFTLLC